MAKNIVVFSDGTGQEGGKGANTNVYKLFNIVEDRTVNQVVFYDQGLGTGMRKFTGNVSGMGISKNIKECYEFIFDNYDSGDQIYLFGFSRGAATVRSLSSFINYFGVLPKSRPDLIDKAYKIYKITNEEKRKTKATAFVEKNHTMWVNIKFLGVWDTVAALGVPIKTIDVILDKIPFFKHSFQNFDLCESVQNAVQALAIDEQRKTFHPVFWNPNLKKGQTMKQVWFAGVHTDVGGGYKEDNLSDIPLVWMMDQAIKNGLRIYKDHKVQINQDANGKMHDSREGFVRSLFRKEERNWNEKTHGKPVVHASVLKRTFDTDNESTPYKPWTLDFEFDIEPWVKKLPK